MHIYLTCFVIDILVLLPTLTERYNMCLNFAKKYRESAWSRWRSWQWGAYLHVLWRLVPDAQLCCLQVGQPWWHLQICWRLWHEGEHLLRIDLLMYDSNCDCLLHCHQSQDGLAWKFSRWICCSILWHW